MFSLLAILADMLQSLTCYLLRWDVMSMLLYLSLLGIFIETYSLSTWQGGACIRAWSLCARISINTRCLGTDTDPGTQHRPGSGPGPLVPGLALAQSVQATDTDSQSRQ